MMVARVERVRFNLRKCGQIFSEYLKIPEKLTALYAFVFRTFITGDHYDNSILAYANAPR